MTSTQATPKVLNISLWILQFLLATTLIWAALMKLGKPPRELAVMWPWAGEVSPALVRLTGIADLIGGLGLILPALLRIKPVLTPVAALGVVGLMICAGVFHLMRGEASQIGFNSVVAGIAALVAWGRFRKARLASR